MEKARALVTVRDINLLCQHYKTYAQIEGRATRRKGVLEVRTAPRDEWVQPVAWIEWANDQRAALLRMAGGRSAQSHFGAFSTKTAHPSSCKLSAICTVSLIPPGLSSTATVTVARPSCALITM